MLRDISENSNIIKTLLKIFDLKCCAKDNSYRSNVIYFRDQLAAIINEKLRLRQFAHLVCVDILSINAACVIFSCSFSAAEFWRTLWISFLFLSELFIKVAKYARCFPKARHENSAMPTEIFYVRCDFLKIYLNRNIL